MDDVFAQLRSILEPHARAFTVTNRAGFYALDDNSIRGWSISFATVVKKRAAVKRIAPDGKTGDDGTAKRKGTATSRTTRAKAPTARKTGTSATARKSKRR